MAGGLRVDALDNLRGLRITSLDDDDEEVVEEIAIDEDEDEEANDSVVLGFVEKPKNPRSLLRHLFPSKAGGVPVCHKILQLFYLLFLKNLFLELFFHKKSFDFKPMWEILYGYIAAFEFL